MFIRLATGLVVAGGDSRSEGCGFESHNHTVAALIILKFVMFLLKSMKTNQKEADDGPLENHTIMTTRKQLSNF